MSDSDGAAAAPKREKRTIVDMRESKKTGERMVHVSLPDYTTARWAEAAGVDAITVGCGSVAMMVYGYPNTVAATVDMMVAHSAAVRRGAPNTFLIGGMPYQSFNTPERALVNATRLMQEAGCDAVKPQAGKAQAGILRALVDAGIPTMSHAGLTPQTMAMFGGWKVQGRTAAAAMKILEDTLAIEDAGCFMVELEAMPAKIAETISRQLTIPTVGIGTGAGTDHQVLLAHDFLGMFTAFKPKFTKRYGNISEIAIAAIRRYGDEVRAGAFPDDEHSYAVAEAEYEAFLNLVEKRKQL